ncbi:MAG: hypothetical protein ACR2RE_00730 [Geminicoccaceae bacterium]
MTDYKADITEIDGKLVVGPKLALQITDEDVVEPPPDNDELEALIKAAVEETLLEAPEYPAEYKKDGFVDDRDFSFGISHDELWKYRLNEGPWNKAPAIINGETDETLITAFGARGESYQQDTAALEEAAKRTANGGVIKVPIGHFKIDQAELPSHKNWTLRGTSMRGSELVSAPGHDIIRVTGWNAQRRLQNQHCFEQISFYLNSSSASHDHSKDFNRRTWSGEPVAHAAIAYIQEKHSGESAERKHNWVNSFQVLDRVFVHGDKNGNGPAAFYADNCAYGLKVLSLFIGDHSSTQAGVPMGCILGRPPFGHAQEYTPDELHIGVMTHWNARCSVSAANVANGYIGHLVCYGSTGTAIDLPGVDSGARKRGRDWVIGQLYVDNDPHPTKSDRPLVHIDSDFCKLGLLHVKGSRVSSGATHRPLIKLSGERIKGDITVMSSSHHKSPRFQISGDHNDLTISAGGVHGNERSTLVNGSPSAPGVVVV